jgi:hypothetical protein
VRASIRFRGVIRGCRDHQWLIADALWEVGAGPTESVPDRWVIASPDPSLDPFPTSRGVFSRPGTAAPSPRLIAHDRLTGWTASAASADELAARIRTRFRDDSPPAPPSPPDSYGTAA